MTQDFTRLVSTLLVGALMGCGSPEEAPRVELPVTLDSSGITTVRTDLDYEVELFEARMMVENFAFSIAGQAHAAPFWRRVSDWLVPTACAHPGHFQGGDVTGELRGRFLLSWLPEGETDLGTATLLVGDYESANFIFARASTEDGLSAEDPLLGHTAILRGQASKSARSVAFTLILDSPKERQLVGVPFEFAVQESTTAQLGVRLLTGKRAGGGSFDGIDFSALDQDGDGQLMIGPEASDAEVEDAYNRLRRRFQTHNHYDIRATQPD